jgi:hypothetical protein
MTGNNRKKVGQQVSLTAAGGERLALEILRPIRLGQVFYFVTTSPDRGGLYVLGRDDTGVRLVTDPAILQRVEQQLMVLADASHGEIIEWTVPGQPPTFWGVVYALFVDGREVLLAASLVDPGVVGAFARTADGVTIVDDAADLTAVQRRFDEILAPVERELPTLQALTAGMWGERIEVRDAQGETHVLRARGRLVFEKKQVVFVSPEGQSEASAPLEIDDRGQLSPISDRGFLARLAAHMQKIAALAKAERAGGAPPDGPGSLSA